MVSSYTEAEDSFLSLPGFLNSPSWLSCPEMGFFENVSLLPHHTMSVSGIPFNTNWPEKLDEKITWIFPLLLVLLFRFRPFWFLGICPALSELWGWHQGRARRARRYFKTFPHILWLTRTHFLIPVARMMDLFQNFCCPCLPCNSLIQSVCGATSGVKRPKKKENPKQTPSAPLPPKLKQTKTRTLTLPVVLIFLQISDSLFSLPAVVCFAKSSGCFLDCVQSF